MMAMLCTIPLAIGLTLAMALAPAQQVRLSEVDREKAITHLRAGQEALATERLEEAEREFRAAIQLNPRLELAHYGLGQVFMATKRYDNAVDAFVTCRNLFQDYAGQNQDVRMLFERQLADQLQSKREELRALQAGRVQTGNQGATIDRVRSEVSQLENLRHRNREPAVAIPPFVLTALGSAYFRKGAFENAEREWRQAAAVDPKIGEIHNNLAVVCMLTGRYDEAEREIQLAEKAGFRVHPQLKEDVKARRK